MNRFASPENRQRIDIGDGDWVEIPGILTREELEAVKASRDSKNESETLRKLVLAWNLKDGDAVAPVDVAHMDRLDFRVVNRIWQGISSLMELPKGNASGSGEPSPEADAARS